MNLGAYRAGTIRGERVPARYRSSKVQSGLMSRGLLFLLLALVSSRPADALSEGDKFGWTEYRNDRFGLIMRYPSAVFSAHRSSASGDGDLYETSDGKARLLVGVLANTDHFTPRSYQTFIARQSYPGLKADYAPISGTWTVLSGTIDGTMIYEKAMFSCGNELISTFAMTYPVAERRFYDRIVEVIEHTFRPEGRRCAQNASRF